METEKIRAGDIAVSLSSNFYRDEGAMYRAIRTNSTRSITYRLNKSVHKGQNRDAPVSNFRKATKIEIAKYYLEGNGEGTKIGKESPIYNVGDLVVVKSNLTSGLQFGTFSYPAGVSYIPGETLTIKEIAAKGQYVLDRSDIKLNDSLIDHKATLAIPKTFPSTGWCKNPSNAVYSYIIKEFNQGHHIKQGANGIAWNGRSVWKIKNKSEYKFYHSKILDKLCPYITSLGSVDIDSYKSITTKEKVTDYGWPLLSLDTPKKQDEFSQQEAIIISSKKKKRNIVL